MNENSVQPKGSGDTLFPGLEGQDVFHRTNNGRLPASNKLQCVPTAAKIKGLALSLLTVNKKISSHKSEI